MATFDDSADIKYGVNGKWVNESGVVTLGDNPADNLGNPADIKGVMSEPRKKTRFMLLLPVLFAFLVAFIYFAALLARQAENPDGTAGNTVIVYYTITFETAGGSPVSPETIPSSAKMGAPKETSKDGYVFEGWWSNSYFDGPSVIFPCAFTGDTVLYAKWAKYHTLSFVTERGVTPSSRKVSANADGVELPSPEYDGADFRFDGWRDNEILSGAAVSNPYTVRGDTTLYAAWVRVYAVTLDVKGIGSVSPRVLRADLGASVTLPAPNDASNSYAFKGWYDNADLSGSAVSNAYTVGGDITLYAEWLVNEYTVRIVHGNGGAETTAVVKANAPVLSLSTPEAVTGYVFDGWRVDGAGAIYNGSFTVTAGVTLVGKWTRVYEVTLISERGSVAPLPLVREDANQITLPVPVSDGYAFGGWYPAADSNFSGAAVTSPYTVSANVSLRAKWTACYTVVYGADAAGAVPFTPPSVTAKSGETVSLPAAVYPAHPNFGERVYELEGWYYDEEFTLSAGAPGESFTVGNIVSPSTVFLYPKWLEKFTITLDVADGVLPAGTPVAVSGLSGVAVVLPTPVRSGYYFGGWYTAALPDVLLTGEYTLAETVTLRALWVREFKLTFVTNGGVVTADGATFAESYVLSVAEGSLVSMAVVARSGYVFEGWFADENLADGPYSADYCVFSSATYYAKWRAA